MSGDPRDPAVRLREAMKQITLAQERLEDDTTVDPAMLEDIKKDLREVCIALRQDEPVATESR